MATSQVDIVNKALGYLAAGSIVAMTETSTKAQEASRIFESVRDEVLAGYAWGFATCLTTLALLANETVPGWEYLYVRPVKCLRVRKLYEDTSVPNPPGADFREVISPTTGQQCIATSISPAYVEFTYQVIDPNQFTPGFIEAFAYKLAAGLANVLTGKEESIKTFQGLYLTQVSEAKRLDGLEKKISDTSESTYLQARG